MVLLDGPGRNGKGVEPVVGESLAELGLDEAYLELVIDEHQRGVIPRLEKNWAYFRDAGGAGPAGPSSGTGGGIGFGHQNGSVWA